MNELADGEGTRPDEGGVCTQCTLASLSDGSESNRMVVHHFVIVIPLTACGQAFMFHV